MDFNATIDIIIKDLNDTRDIIDDLKKYPGVPVLQVELAKSKCKSAGEVIALLKTLKEIQPAVKEDPVLPIQNQNQEPDKKLPEEMKTPPKYVSIFSQPESKKKEPKPQVNTSPPVVQKKETEKTPEKEQASTIIADKFSNHSNSFNELLGTAKNEDDISDILSTKPITSLSEAIGVNDKFIFIREIFRGDKDSYSQAISRLNNVESIDDARAIIMSYTGESNENEAVMQLLHLVKRKLA